MKEFRTGQVRANGLRFAFLEEGDGPLLLCLHGFPDHARSFRYQLPAFAEAGYRAVAPFLRGYAPTEIPADGRYQTAVLAQDTIELIAALGYSSAVVFGHDWGALAAYGAAVLAPERVEKLVTAAVPHGPAFLQAFMTSYDQLRRSWYMFFFQHPFADVAVPQAEFAFIERLWRDWSPGWQCKPEEMELLKQTFRAPGVLQAALGYYRCALDPGQQAPELSEVQQRLGTAPIEVPSLVLYGARDGCVGVELLEGMEVLFPNGLRKVVIEGAGHFVHQERPDDVNAAVVGFLRS